MVFIFDYSLGLSCIGTPERTARTLYNPSLHMPCLVFAFVLHSLWFLYDYSWMTIHDYSSSSFSIDGMLIGVCGLLIRVQGEECSLLFFTLVTGPKNSLNLKLSDTRVYAPQIRARLGTTAHWRVRKASEL